MADEEVMPAPQDHVGNAERGLKKAEEALAADPENRSLKDEVAVRKRNLEKAKRL